MVIIKTTFSWFIVFKFPLDNALHMAQGPSILSAPGLHLQVSGGCRPGDKRDLSKTALYPVVGCLPCKQKINFLQFSSSQRRGPYSQFRRIY